MGYTETLGGTRHVFPDLKTLLARATPSRSGDRLAGVAAAERLKQRGGINVTGGLGLHPGDPRLLIGVFGIQTV